MVYESDDVSRRKNRIMITKGRSDSIDPLSFDAGLRWRKCGIAIGDLASSVQCSRRIDPRFVLRRKVRKVPLTHGKGRFLQIGSSENLICRNYNDVFPTSECLIKINETSPLWVLSPICSGEGYKLFSICKIIRNLKCTQISFGKFSIKLHVI